MKTTNTFSIHFKLRMEREKDGYAPVFMGLNVGGRRSYLALKSFQVDVTQWDKTHGCGKKNTRAGRDINEYLDDLRAVMRSHYRTLELKGYTITLEALKDLFMGVVKEEAEVKPTFSELIAYHNEQGQRLLAKGTMSHYLVTQRYIVKFLSEKYRKQEYFLGDLNYKFISDFELFLYNHTPKDHQKPMDTNGVAKHLIRLKKMVNLAVNLGWIKANPFLGFKLKKKRVDKEFLTKWELQEIEAKKFKIPRLIMVRDLFVFSCYTGLAYTDLMALKPENIVKGIDGGLWIRTNRQKTDIPVNTPILPKAKEILDRYDGNIRAEVTGTIFPVISNQKLNSYLKEIADGCDITKNLTFHVARHTFATTVTLSNGVPIETVSKLLGHNKLSTTQIYARVLEKKISEDMALLREKLG